MLFTTILVPRIRPPRASRLETKCGESPPCLEAVRARLIHVFSAAPLTGPFLIALNQITTFQLQLGHHVRDGATARGILLTHGYARQPRVSYSTFTKVTNLGSYRHMQAARDNSLLDG